MNKSALSIAVLAALALLASGAYFFLGGGTLPFLATEKTATTTEEAQTPNYTIEEVPYPTLEEMAPSLTRGVHFGETIPSDIRSVISARYAELQPLLKADLTKADLWFDLGLLYHSANDFDGAREVWLFLLQVLPDTSKAVVYDNLGKLYKFNLKDYPKSEEYFRLSMKANTNSLTSYTELFELYRYLYKTDTTAAVDIITEAANKFPKATDPYTLLGQYYRDKGEYAKAREAYTKGLDRARDAGDMTLVRAIGDELATLPQ